MNGGGYSRVRFKKGHDFIEEYSTANLGKLSSSAEKSELM